MIKATIRGLRGWPGRGRLLAITLILAASTAIGVPASSQTARPEQEEDIQRIAELLDVTSAEAEQRLLVQAEVHDLFNEELRAARPAFAGAYIDQTSGEAVFLATSKDEADRLLGLAQQRVTERSRARTRVVEHSLSDLVTLADKIHEEATTPAGREEILGSGVDHERNVVFVDLIDPTSQYAHSLEVEYGDRLDLRQGEATETDHVSAACASRQDCTNAGAHPWRAAIRITRGTSICSSGFWARDENYAGSFFFTAGHCGAQSSVWSHNGVAWGPMTHRVINQNLDGAVIRDDSAAGGNNYLYHTDANSNRKVNGIIGNNGQAMQGSTLCRAGQTSGHECGIVENGHANFTHSSGVAMVGQLRILLDCTLGGDSGGPTYALTSNATAYSIHHSSEAAPTCNNVADDSSWSSYIYEFTQTWGFRVPTAGVHGY